MFRRPAAFALGGVVLLLALSVAFPLAAADHSYSHRYVIYGRVVDAEGNPVPSLTLDLTAALFNPEGACRDTTGSDLNTDAYGPTVYDPVTDEFGDFTFCFHVHQLNRVEPGRGTIVIRDMPEMPAITVEFNPYFRSQFVLIQLEEPSERANDDRVSGQYTVLGRLWREAASKTTTVEGIEVYGETLRQEPVEIELVDPSGNVVATATSQSNDYGDFAVRVPTDARFTEGTIRMAAAGENFTQPAAQSGITFFEADFPAPPSDTLKNVLVVGGGILLAGAVIGGGYYGIQKITERRELEQARANTTRKRANR